MYKENRGENVSLTIELRAIENCAYMSIYIVAVFGIFEMLH